jgi:hypothetical protein
MPEEPLSCIEVLARTCSNNLAQRTGNNKPVLNGFTPMTSIAEIPQPKKFLIPFKIEPKPKTTIVGSDELGIGVLEIPTYGQLLTAEKAAIEEAELWDRDVNDRETSKLSKSIYDREKAKGSKVTLAQYDLAVRRLLEGYDSITIADQNLIGDYAIEVKEFVESGAKSIQELAQSIYDRAVAKTPDLSTSKAQYDAALQRMIAVYKADPLADKELLEEYYQEILAFAKTLATESDRRFYTFALVIMRSRMPGLEEMTLGDLRDLVGRPLLARLGYFGFYEDLGKVYVEAIEYPTEAAAKEPIEERSEADILKP